MCEFMNSADKNLVMGATQHYKHVYIKDIPLFQTKQNLLEDPLWSRKVLGIAKLEHAGSLSFCDGNVVSKKCKTVGT